VTFALAFFARPVGSALFGHFGDRIGRKATLVVSLLLMGVSTVSIGALPTYASIGIAAPLLLCLFRFGQGLGVGGEWGGAILLATENAPPGRRASYAMFPQLGAPLGFVFSTATFLVLTRHLGDRQFFAWGWRVPFLASALLVAIGLYVRLKLTETPAFLAALQRNERVRVPMLVVFTRHAPALALGTCMALSIFVVFYLMTVFTLSWATTQLGYVREDFLVVQMIGIVFFAASIAISALAADRHGGYPVLRLAAVLIILFGLFFAPLFTAKIPGGAMVFMAIGMFAMGLIYGPLGAALAELFPTHVRYTGASVAFNLAGIFGGSLAPYAATWLATHHGLQSVGYYVSVATAVTLVALILAERRYARTSK
jgi:MFS family permease